MSLGKNDVYGTWLLISLLFVLIGYSYIFPLFPSPTNQVFCRTPIIDTEEIKSVHLTSLGNVYGFGQIYNFNSSVNSTWPIFQTLDPYPSIKMIDPVFVGKFDEQMNLLWSRLIDFGTRRGLITTQIDKMENVYIFAQSDPTAFQGIDVITYGLPKSNRQYALLKLNSEGEIDWITLFQANSFSDVTLFPREDGEILISGYTDFSLPSELSFSIGLADEAIVRPVIVSVKNDGSPRWIGQFNERTEIEDISFLQSDIAILTESYQGRNNEQFNVSLFEIHNPYQLPTTIDQHNFGTFEQNRLPIRQFLLALRNDTVDGIFEITPQKIAKFNANSSIDEFHFRTQPHSQGFGFSATKSEIGIMIRMFALNGMAEFNENVSITPIDEHEGTNVILLFDYSMTQALGIIFPSLFAVPRPVVGTDGKSVVLAGRTNSPLIQFIPGFQKEINGFFDPLLLHVDNQTIYGTYFGGNGLPMKFCY